MNLIQLYQGICRRIDKHLLKYKWRKRNKHNYTKMINSFRIEKVQVGKCTYGEIEVIDYSDWDTTVQIGAYCSIASRVVFLLGGEHSLNRLSTYPFKVKLLKQADYEAGSKGDIIIGDDVWIGMDSMIMSGVTVGKGAVIAAKSLVNKDVPPYAIVAGVPAKVIRYRFEPEIIEKLMEIDFKKIDQNVIQKNINVLYTEVTKDNVDEIMKQLK